MLADRFGRRMVAEQIVLQACAKDKTLSISLGGDAAESSIYETSSGWPAEPLLAWQQQQQRPSAWLLLRVLFRAVASFGRFHGCGTVSCPLCLIGKHRERQTSKL